MILDGLKVVDAKRDRDIEITTQDCRRGNKKDPGSCAAALACKRIMKTTKAMVYSSRVYVQQGKSWLRYITPRAIAAEIIAFDRGGNFLPGKYTLMSPGGATKLGYYKPTGPKAKGGKKRRHRQVTLGIRQHAPFGTMKSFTE